MRQVTTVTNVYPFEQLEEEIQDRAIEKLWEINVYHDWWDSDFCLELTQSELGNLEGEFKLTDKENNFLTKNCLFDLTIKAFDIGRNNYIQLDIIVNNDEIFRKYLGISEELWENCYYQFKIGRTRNSDTYLEITENDTNEEFTDNETQIVEVAEELMNYKIMSVLYQLKDSYSYLTSQESIIETILCNEYEFTSDGEIF